MDDICILTTGGTIDKEHDPITEKLVFSDKSHVPKILEQCRVDAIPHETLMLKDSLEITDEDRETIKNAILKRTESAVIVTHGTSTMAETATFLKDEITDKTVILTGALRPFSLFQSDAGFNLGTAIIAAQTQKPGIYIAMNGRVFQAGNVQKNSDTGHFESLSS